MKNVLLAAVDDGVAGVIAALAADDDIGVGRKDVDDFAFAFIAPLRADENCICHRVAVERKSRTGRTAWARSPKIG